MAFMVTINGWIARVGAVINQNGPWGGNNNGNGGESGGSGGGSGDGGDGPRNPWTQPPGGDKRKQPRGPSFMDELSRTLKGGKLPGGGASINWRYLVGAFVLLWIALTSIHRIGPQEEGVILRFGKYAGKLSSGIGLTLPAPIDKVMKVDVREIKTIEIPKGQGENLILTSDQNIVDLDYSVRWSRRNAELYLFQMVDPEETIGEVAESAMREVVSTVSLNDTIGSGRGEIETRVQQRMQQLLDYYRTGVSIQGVAIQRADPPAQVNDAFKRVTAAQQTAQTYINQANAYAQQITAKAQGEATSFDKVYEQYRLAPGVTRRRMYYETMEGVLAKVDKTIIEAPGVTPYLALPEVKKRQVIVEPGQ